MQVVDKKEKPLDYQFASLQSAPCRKMETRRARDFRHYIIDKQRGSRNDDHGR